MRQLQTNLLNWNFLNVRFQNLNDDTSNFFFEFYALQPVNSECSFEMLSIFWYDS